MPGFICEASGQRVSLNKSEVFFSPNVSMEESMNILEVAGILRIMNLGRYLESLLFTEG